MKELKNLTTMLGTVRARRAKAEEQVARHKKREKELVAEIKAMKKEIAAFMEAE